MEIKFVSYSGSYPNLCSGTLVVEIDGKRVSFGWTDPKWLQEEKADYPRFWCSGGGVGFDGDWSEIVSTGDWELSFSEKDYPAEIAALMPELICVFNENVRPGCCGGCV